MVFTRHPIDIPMGIPMATEVRVKVPRPNACWRMPRRVEAGCGAKNSQKGLDGMESDRNTGLISCVNG